MLRSMTGFGAASSEVGGLALRVEARSVNHRHLQVKVRVASELVALEGEVERLVRKRLSRGAVTVNLTVARMETSLVPALDVEAAARYRGEIERLQGRLGIGGNVPVEALLSLPGVVSTELSSDSLAGRGRQVLELVGEGLDALIEMRGVEGAALEADIRRQLTAIAKLVGRIEKRMPTVVRTHQRNLRKRVTELLNGTPLEPSDLAREVALLADRLDVGEELARLASHLDQFTNLLDKGGAIGRKLDFLTQEVFREMNTIGAKCSDSKVAHWIVDAKTHAERVREQVQNLE